MVAFRHIIAFARRLCGEEILDDCASVTVYCTLSIDYSFVFHRVKSLSLFHQFQQFVLQ
jgi:hypothetical protein